MKRYVKVKLASDTECVRAECDGLSVEASSTEDALEGIMQELEYREVKKIKKNMDVMEGVTVTGEETFLVETDFENAYRLRYSNAARRNVTLPVWMDEMIRNYGLDASRIFQTAITKEIEDRKKISNTKELRAKINNRILEEFLQEEMEKRLKGDK